MNTRIIQQFSATQNFGSHGTMTTMVNKPTQKLTSSGHTTLFNLILDQLTSIVDHNGALITLLDKDELIVLAYRGPLAAAEVIEYRMSQITESPFRQALQQQAPAVLDDIWNGSIEPATQSWLGKPQNHRIFNSFHSLLCIPVFTQKQATGLLILGHHAPNYFSQHNNNNPALLDFAHTIAEAVEYSHLYRLAHNLATLEERDRLAQELHDNVAQSLGYINLQLAAVNEMLSGGKIEKAQDSLRSIKQVVGETYTDVREEIFNMRSAEMIGLGFLHTLREYITKYSKFYNLEIKLEVKVDETLLDFPTSVETQVIRIIQEALINVRKHAGVDEALIRIQAEDNRFAIIIEDRGHGFSDEPPLKPDGKSGFGLQIMAERAESVGGLLQIDTPAHGGTKVIIWLPVSLSTQLEDNEEVENTNLIREYKS